MFIVTYSLEYFVSRTSLRVFSTGDERYAETWDYKVRPSSFLQFDIAMGCSGTLSTRYSIQLQYSVDMGRTWRSVVEPCGPRARRDCTGYHLSNDFLSEAYANWTRVTLYLPPGSVLVGCFWRIFSTQVVNYFTTHLGTHECCSGQH